MDWPSSAFVFFMSSPFFILTIAMFFPCVATQLQDGGGLDFSIVDPLLRYSLCCRSLMSYDSPVSDDLQDKSPNAHTC